MTARSPAAATPSPRPHLRCAIYTRKSSEEGLGQAFNSLDAQAEACAAYVASQRHEGWRLLPERYDDGGLSGGTLARPALQRLLAEIDAGRVQMVVVYKIDRLTRSLADFAKLVERMETAGCSFVSVTQSFNTSTSMGRLTLNVLLSFAQFEREVGAERIRDKIAASKRKGMWMGGPVPLGYDRHPDPMQRGLVVNEAEAEQVRTLFRLYEELGCTRRLEEAAREQGLRSKVRTTKDGRTVGGGVFSRGQLHYLLTNITYRGLIRHKTEAYPGQHPAIVDEALWDRVQAQLKAAAVLPRRGWRRDRREAGSAVADTAGSQAPVTRAPLIGKLRDETGDRLVPTFTVKDGRRLRYYVSKRLTRGGLTEGRPGEESGEARRAPGLRRAGKGEGSGGTRPTRLLADPSRPDHARATGWRLPAPALEEAIAEAVAGHLEAAAATCSLTAEPRVAEAAQLTVGARQIAARLREAEGSGTGSSRGAFLSSLLREGHLGPGILRLDLDAEVLAAELGTAPDGLAPSPLTLTLPFALRRRGVELKLVAGQVQAAPTPDPTLLGALARAHRWAKAMKAGTSLSAIAAKEGASEPFVSSRVRLAFLAPKIQAAIVAGTQAPHLTLERILRAGVPLDWDEQARVYGVEGNGGPTSRA